MDRIGGPQHVREGLVDALSQGIGVTAKMSWLTQTPRSNAQFHASDDASISTEPDGSFEGRPRWIHCTPLLGSDSKPGVIMVVMVDKEEITGALHTHSASPRPVRSRQTMRLTDHTRDGWPLRGAGSAAGLGAARYTGSKLYADYLRREGRSASREERRLPPTPLESGMVNGGMASLHSPSVSGRSTPVQVGGASQRSLSVRRRGGRETA